MQKEVKGVKRIRVGYIYLKRAHESGDYWIVQSCLEETNGLPCTMNRDGVIKPTCTDGVEALIGQQKGYQFFLSQKLEDIVENFNRKDGHSSRGDMVHSLIGGFRA